MIKTRRLNIFPASREKMEEFIASQTIEVLKVAYTEMLEGCLRHPEQWEWYAIWMIELKDGTHIGELCFKGLDETGAAEIGYGILKEYKGHGYASEAVAETVRWAMAQPCATCITAETDAQNIASQRVLEKSGFAATGRIGVEGPIYSYGR